MQPFDITVYRWCLVGLDLAYLFLGVAAAKENKYPASRHRKSFGSKCWVGMHIVLGAIVIYGGATIFVLDNQAVSLQHCTWVLRCIAVSALLHAVTVPGMLAKVPGCRKLTVPYYFGVTIINLYTATQVLRTPSVQNLMLLWGAVSAFVYVRFFVFIFHIVSGGADFMVIYTLAMGLSGYFATVANGLNGLSLLIITTPVFVAPVMVMYSRWYHSTFANEILHNSHKCGDVSDATLGRSDGLLFSICTAVHDAFNPVDVPHQPSYKVGWYRTLVLWFAADNLPVVCVNIVDPNMFSVRPGNVMFAKNLFEPGNSAV